MLLGFFIAILLGLLAGTLTGLTPGVHINLISSFLLALSLKLNNTISSIHFIVFIVAMSITHTFVDFIPSILLGCPDTDTELSILPGHQLLKEGEGYKAIILTLYGSLAAIIAIRVFAFPIIYLKNFIISAYPYIKLLIPSFLILISLILISRETNKYKALFIFLLTGLLGYLVLNFQGLNQPMLPLLTGLFGASNLILSIKNNTEIPLQKIENPEIPPAKSFLGSLIASPLCCFFPALGSGTYWKYNNKNRQQRFSHTNRNDKYSRYGFLIYLFIYSRNNSHRFSSSNKRISKYLKQRNCFNPHSSSLNRNLCFLSNKNSRQKNYLKNNKN